MRDHVCCFHCDGKLKHWVPEDEPWNEHARWFPTCTFLLLVKGQDFVDEIQRHCDVEIQPKPPVDGAGTSNSDFKAPLSTLQG